MIKELGRNCAFDVLENHKHIDMSAESAILIFISGIWKNGYQKDAKSEIEKMLSHNGLPIILTDLNDHRFDDFFLSVKDESGEKNSVSLPTIKLPSVPLQYAYPLNVFLLNKIVKTMRSLSA
jgi:hypothetical protein